MAKRNNTEKIQSIEEQIKELEKKKKSMIDQLHVSIGKAIVSEWGTTDQEEIIRVIIELKDEAIARLNPTH